jgi:UDP-N-acetylglucosamine diphosphorylase/glucosamine-1-phosphate N-acetyltransferase
MRICIYEDGGVARLEPLTLTRPAFDLWCGAGSLLDRQRRCLGPGDLGAVVRTPLTAICQKAHPELRVNDLSWLQAGPIVLVNARWMPSIAEALDLSTPHAGMVGDQLAYAVLPAAARLANEPQPIEAEVERWKAELPSRPVGGWMIHYPWDLVTANPEALVQEIRSRQSEGKSSPPAGLVLHGPADQLWVHPLARVEPLVLADTTHGPVLIDRVATIKGFSRLEGPCYIGPGTWVLGARISVSTIGPVCRVGGEVDSSIIQGFSNKAHDGYLGNSYVGEWVNLGAGTQVSNLRTDYRTIRMPVAGQEVDSGLTKVGTFFGDHVKTGISTLLNVGTQVGAFSQLFHSSQLPPRFVPPFCRFARGRLEEGVGLDQLLFIAETAMSRRGLEFSREQTEYVAWLHRQTAPLRERVLREGARPGS